MNKIEKSIVNNASMCYICGSPYYHIHHIMFGKDRKLAEKYGLTIALCREHHEGNYSPHQVRELDLELKRMAQTKFEERYSHELWMKEFGRNYL